MRRILLPLIASLLSPAALAADPLWFEIEMIVFKRDKGESTERWPFERPALETGGSIDLLTPVLQPSARHLKAMLPSCTEVPADPYTFEQATIIDLPPLQATLDEQQQLAVDFSEKFQRLSDFEETAASQYATTTPVVALAEQDSEMADTVMFEEQPADPMTLPRFGACQFPEEIDWLFGEHQQSAEPRKSRRTITAALDEDSRRPYLLDKASLQLGEMAQKLRWFKGTRPLLHLGWRQPVYARHQAKPFYFYGGAEFSERYQADGAQRLPDENDVSDNAVTANSLDELAVRLYGDQGNQDGGAIPADAITGTELLIDPEGEIDGLKEEVPPALWEIEGLFKVYLNRFLFIETQFNRQQEATRLILDPDAQPEGTDALADAGQPAVATGPIGDETPKTLPPRIEVPWLQTYPFEQHRRVRSKEIHYFDHPKMGIVVQIRRFKRSSAGS